jgi:hypothetical protein
VMMRDFTESLSSKLILSTSRWIISFSIISHTMNSI